LATLVARTGEWQAGSASTRKRAALTTPCRSRNNRLSWIEATRSTLPNDELLGGRHQLRRRSRSGSHWTPRWRKTDSNSRSHLERKGSGRAPREA
jgi:hypothetical protein